MQRGGEVGKNEHFTILKQPSAVTKFPVEIFDKSVSQLLSYLTPELHMNILSSPKLFLNTQLL